MGRQIQVARTIEWDQDSDSTLVDPSLDIMYVINKGFGVDDANGCFHS